MKYLLIALGILPFSNLSLAQTTFPVNGATDKNTTVTVIENITIHQDAYTVLENASITVGNGKILGVNLTKAKNAVVIDGSGKHLYASFIDPYTSYGMPKTPAKERSYSPQYESKKEGAYGWNESLNPERRASLLVKHNQKLGDSYRSVGFGTVLTHYPDGIHRGSGALITLGSNENINLVKPEASAHLSFSKGRSNQAFPNSLMGAIALIRQTYYDAEWYNTEWNHSEENLTLAAWNELENLPQVFECKEMLDILRADRLGEEFAVQYLFKGQGDEYQRISEIKETRGALIIPVNYPKPFEVIDPFMANTIELEELKHWELAPYNGFFLEDNGVSFAFTASGLKDRSDFLANVRKAVKCGLSQEKALEALTTEPAKLLNVSNELGSIKPGYWANFIVTNGNLFNEKTKILENWVQGEHFTIATPPNKKLIGEFNLSIDKELYRLRVKDVDSGVLFTHANLDKPDSLGAKVSINYKDPFINLSFSLNDDKGIYRLTGADVTDGKILEGSGISPKGDSFEWVAVWQNSSSKQNSSGSKADTTLNLETKNPYDLLIYPFTAYGNIDTLEQELLYIKNATIWTCDSLGKLEQGEILIANGEVKGVGESLDLEALLGKKWSELDITEINGYGLHVTPGIIDEHSHIAISRGVNESSQASTAEVRIGDVINSEDVNIYRQLAGGVTTSQLLHGSANPIGGQSALIKLRWGAAPEEMKYEGADGFMKFALGENVKQSNKGNNYRSRFPQTRMGVEQVYYDHFHKAREYRIEWDKYQDQLASVTKRQRKRGELPVSPRFDIELEALAEILNHERFITCHSYMQHEINMLMHVADSMGFTINTFTHILEGYKVADKMKAHGAGASTYSDWWGYKYEVKDAIPYNGALLWEQGITVAYNSDDREMARRLNQEAAKAVKYGGVPEEEALKFVTLNPAKLLHIDDKVGSLSVGKDADFVIWNAHPLSIYAKPNATYIDGKCYFSLEKDLALRENIKVERNRLIQLMAAEGTEGGARLPGRKKAQHYHCNTITNELH